VRREVGQKSHDLITVTKRTRAFDRANTARGISTAGVTMGEVAEARTF
jgi:hypothetical protein